MHSRNEEQRSGESPLLPTWRQLTLAEMKGEQQVPQRHKEQCITHSSASNARRGEGKPVSRPRESGNRAAESHDMEVQSQGARAAAGPIRTEPADVNNIQRGAIHLKELGMHRQPCFALHDT